MHSHLYLAGAGPYHEEHTTSLLLEHLSHVDVILYDRLINESLLSYAKKTCIVEYVGKSLNETIHTQDYINQRIGHYLQQNLSVLRLKSGDPFLFGRGFEEYTYARQHNFPVTIIPGLSSSLAIATQIGLPLTLRNVSHGVTILTGMDANQEVPAFSFNAQHHSYVFLMSVRHFNRISQEMQANGFSPTTPTIAISNGTYMNQQIVGGSLSTIHQKMQHYGQKNPAIIVVSPTIPVWQEIYTPTLLSTKIDGADLPLLDHTYMFHSIHTPLLTHTPQTLSSDDLKKIEQAHTIVLSSPITASYASAHKSHWAEKTIVAIGPKTYATAKQNNLTISYDPNITSLSDYISKHNLDNTVILTSDYGKEIRHSTPWSNQIISLFSLSEQKIDIQNISYDAITVYSPSTLHALLNAIKLQNKQALFDIPLFCFGQNVYEQARHSDFKHVHCIQTNDHTFFYQQIHLYFKERHAR